MGEQAWEGRLAEALSQLGSPALLLVEGAAGMGKSRLAQRLAESSTARAVSRLVVSFRASGALAISVPAGRESWAAGTEAPQSRSGGYSPAVDGTTGPAAPVDASAGARLALRAALVSVRPVLLVAEDVHQADDGCLELLREVLREPPERFAAVLTYRPERLPRRGLPLGRAVDYPARLFVTRARLRPLDERQVRGVAEEVLGAERCSAELVSSLRQRSAGVPQVLVDLLWMLRGTSGDRGHFTLQDLAEVGVPVRLAETALDRVEAVPAAHRPVVWAAAVLEQPADVTELSAVAGLPAERGREALIAALRASALQETGDGRYGFAVPLAATAVYQHLPGPLREQLHHRAASTLTARKTVPWARVARHWRNCSRTDEWLCATDRLTDGEGDVTGDETAVALLEQALAERDLPPRRRVRLALALARGATLGLRTERTVQTLRDIVADSALPASARGEVRLELGLLLHNQKRRFHEGREQVRRAVEELSARPDLATAGLAALANPFFPGASLSENDAWLRRAEETAASSRDGTAHTAAAAIRATFLMATGDPTAWRSVARLPRDSSTLADQQQVARALCNIASGAVHLGHHRRGRELLEAGMELAARSNAPFLERVGCGTALFQDWLTGAWHGLAERCTRVVAEDGTANEARAVLALLALAKGEWTAAHDWLPPGGPPTFESCEIPVATTAAGVHIRLLLARDDTWRAASDAASAWRWLGRKGVWVWGAELAPWAVQALTRAGRVTEAEGLVSEFAEGLAGRDAPSAEAALLHCRALLAEIGGEPAAASGYFRQAGAAYTRLSYPYAGALAAEGAGRCGFLAGLDLGEAVDDLTGCVEQLGRLGASWDAARARAILRVHRPGTGRRPRGRPAYTERLSPREAEVAELAGGGLTNREIAVTLHLSPRTVEHHVSRAMRKLGVSLRQELATRAARGGAEGGPPASRGE